MNEEIFLPYHSHLPQHIQDDFEQNEVVMLRSDTNWCLNFESFVDHSKNKCIFVTPDTAISQRNNPSHHGYSIDVIVSLSAATNERTFHVSGVGAEETSPSLNFLLQLILESGSNSVTSEGEISNTTKVVIKCFATTPRQQLGFLDLSPTKRGQKRKTALLAQPSSSQNRIEVDFRFLSLKASHCQLLFDENADIFSCVKLSQCEVDDWITWNSNDDDSKPDNGTTSLNTTKARLPQKLVLSCTQKEFRKFAKGRALVSNRTSICELHLVLHFMLAESDVQHLLSIIQNNKRLKSLSIEILDLDDKTWTCICKSLHGNRNLQSLQIAYTEKFVDSYRRLTPERRHSRTDDVLKLLEVNKTLQEFNWPKFQQDESLIPRIERLLMENKGESLPDCSTTTTS